jgi:hypothetical protein
VVEVDEEMALGPPVVEHSMMDEAFDESEDYEECAQQIVDSRHLAKGELGLAVLAPSMRETARRSMDVQTRTKEVGDLFAYEITQPVDIASSRSALVPIVQTEVNVERVALYNAEIREKNPMTAFRLENSTDLTLEGGPVTVFEGESYVGEAMLDTMRKGEERITPYSVELGIQVQQDANRYDEAFSEVRKRGVYLHKKYRELLVTEYEFASRLEHEVTLYLDHPFRYKVREDTPEPVEITENYWRFKLNAAGKKTTKFTVTEVSEQYERVEVRSIAGAAIHQMVKEKLISAAVKRRLEAIADRVQQIQEIKKQIDKKENEEVKIDKGQKRLRENLKALGKSTEENKLRQKYVATLSGDEERIESLRGAVVELKNRRERENEELSTMVDALKLN